VNSVLDAAPVGENVAEEGYSGNWEIQQSWLRGTRGHGFAAPAAQRSYLFHVRIDDSVGDAVRADGPGYLALMHVTGSGNGGVGVRAINGGSVRIADPPARTSVAGAGGELRVGARPGRSWTGFRTEAPAYSDRLRARHRRRLADLGGAVVLRAVDAVGAGRSPRVRQQPRGRDRRWGRRGAGGPDRVVDADLRRGGGAAGRRRVGRLRDQARPHRRGAEQRFAEVVTAVAVIPPMAAIGWWRSAAVGHRPAVGRCRRRQPDAMG
jgi:hypothetical protein